MGEKTEKRWSRLELADHLKTLSEQLRQGTLESEGRRWNVPAEMYGEVQLREKKGFLKGKISWCWSTGQDYEPAAKEELTRYQDSMKTVKKRLAAAFKELRRAADQGQFPEETALAAFAESSRDFAQLVDPDWQAAMQIYLDHLENLQRAVQHRQLEAMLHELRDLQTCMEDCHREFKSPREREEGRAKGGST